MPIKGQIRLYLVPKYAFCKMSRILYELGKNNLTSLIVVFFWNLKKSVFANNFVLWRFEKGARPSREIAQDLDFWKLHLKISIRTDV